jgi:hypothetical protein
MRSQHFVKLPLDALDPFRLFRNCRLTHAVDNCQRAGTGELSS